MKNRIRHLLPDWAPEADPSATARPQPGEYPMPRGINMLMPVELCIHRELLVTLLTASIDEMQRHQQVPSDLIPDRARAELEAALQQQLVFRSWIRAHPGSYISIALYPTAEVDTVEDMEDPGEF